MGTNVQDNHGWKVIELTSEAKVFQALAELRGQRWLCRGQSKHYGGLLPTIDRDSFQGLSRLEKLNLERQSIDLFRSTVQFFSDPSEQKAKSEDLIALMILRHYNVPTRLLDWSLSPYVAAYFAVCSHDTANGEIWSFDERLYAQEGIKQWTKYPETTIDGSGDPSKFDYRLTTAFGVQEPHNWFVCQFYSGFPRQVVQEGAFSITARFGRDHADAIAYLLKRRDRFCRYVISASLKPALRRTLYEKHGIWRGSLYPDVAGAAETACTVFKKVTEQGVKPSAARDGAKNSVHPE
jgi:hypothetical protein